MTRLGLIKIHPVAMSLQETSATVPKVTGIAKTLFDAARSRRLARLIRSGQTSSSHAQPSRSANRALPNHQPNPQSP